MRAYFSFANMAAGFIAVMVGFTSSAVIVFQAASVAGASPSEISSWLFALGISMALSCVGLSWYYRVPILTGWSTPGAALLVTSLAGVSMPEAIGAFVFAAFLTVLTGITGLFEKVVNHLPRSLCAAMLAGILIHFGMNVFLALNEQMLLIGLMLLTYLVGKRHFPRYVIMMVLLIGILVAYAQGLFQAENLQFSIVTPQFTYPVFHWSTLISVGMPLFVVTMTSQNIPGVAVLQSAGYKPPISKLITWIGGINLVLAPFGSFAISLAAMTAAICCSKEADADPAQRYRSTVFAGLCWLLIGIFGATIVSLLYAFPKELVVALAGLALLGTIGSSLKTAMEDELHREPALITILCCASGINLFGIGSAFWGLFGGLLASVVLNWRKDKILAMVNSAG